MKKWEIMKAFEEGEEIEYHSEKKSHGWQSVLRPSWDWSEYNYRVKPKLELERGQTVTSDDDYMMSRLPFPDTKSGRYAVDTNMNSRNFKADHSLSQWLEFKPWHGGDMPKECEGRRVFVVYANGYSDGRIAFALRWEHLGDSSDIVWYAVIYKFMTENPA